MAAKPPVRVDLHWEGDLRFRVDVPGAPAALPPLVLDSANQAGPSPVVSLVASLGGCLAMDLVHILVKGRHPVTSVQVRLEAVRADEEPRRLAAVRVHFDVAGAVPGAAIERAVALSREKYCSVWHSLRQDIDLQVTFGAAA